jgi:hypothetical protein
MFKKKTLHVFPFCANRKVHFGLVKLPARGADRYFFPFYLVGGFCLYFLKINVLREFFIFFA